MSNSINKQQFRVARGVFILHTLVVGAAAVSACAQTEEGGETKPCGVAFIGVAPQLEQPQILGACVDSAGLQVVFSLAENGAAVTDLAEAEVSGTVAKLMPNGFGDFDWQSYINIVEEPGTPPANDPWPGTEPVIQATRDQGGKLESHGGGVYTYIYKTDITNVTEPLAVPYEPDLTHRVGLEFRSEGAKSLPAFNPTYDWQPSTGKTEGITEHLIAMTSSCNECHANLAVHGGARTQVPYCVTCHNPGSFDAQSGNTIDLPVLVHKIHSGENLVNGFVIWGFRNTKHDFSEVRYPQDRRNCMKCHSVEDPETPQGDYWRLHPAESSCGACHDTTTFSPQHATPADLAEGEPPFVETAVTDAQCATCHTSDAIELVHRTKYSTPNNPNLPPGVPQLTYELISLTNAAAGQDPVVKLRILANGEPLNLASFPDNLPPGLTARASGSPSGSPRLDIAWMATEDGVITPANFNNTGSGNIVGQPRSVQLVALAPADLTLSNDAADPPNTFITRAGVLGTVPTDAQKVAVVLEGRFVVDPDADPSTDNSITLGATSVILDSEGSTSPERDIADIAKCDRCHEYLTMHGDNRINNLQVCSECHNPDATDIGRRPGGPGIDGLIERPIDFRYLIHLLHTGEDASEAQIVWYGFSGPEDFKGVAFPGNRDNCNTCHFEGTFTVPIPENSLATTVVSQDNADPLDDLNVPPTGAACTACHDSPPVKAHGKTAVPQPDLFDTELDDCSICHGSGGIADVSAVHELAPLP